MSRTFTEEPWEVVERRYPDKANAPGYPAPIRGAWPNRKYAANLRNRALRVAVRNALARWDADSIPKPRKQVAWDIW